jgi:hypothetical protein
MIIFIVPFNAKHSPSIDILGHPKVNDDKKDDKLIDNSFSKELSKYMIEQIKTNRDDFQYEMDCKRSAILYLFNFLLFLI